MRVGSWNVGTMTGRGRELVETMARRKVEILCVQETKWKGNSSRHLGEGYKILYAGKSTKMNGVGVIVCKDLADKIVRVVIHSDRIINVQVAFESGLWNIISVYAPQVGRPQEEKDSFLEDLEEVVSRIPGNEMVVIGGDFNVHLGEKCPDYPDEHGQKGLGERNEEGGRLLENIEGLLILQYCEGLLMRILFSLIKQRKHPARTKVWKLRENKEHFNRLVREMKNNSEETEEPSVEEEWTEMSHILEEAATRVCGKTRGGRLRENEEWWWDMEVQEALKEKKKAYKALKDGTGELQEYKRLKKVAKRSVARAKERAWKEWYEKLQTKEGEDQIYKIAKHRAKQKKDIIRVAVLKDGEGRVLIKEEQIKQRWLEYFKNLLNVENERENLVEADVVCGPIQEISVKEVTEAIKEMKVGKATGPSGIAAEHFKNLDEEGIQWLMRLLNNIAKEERIPEEWTKSSMVTIYKEKGDPME
ncbi:CFDP2 protein, partial [Atractosteus spatula]|nr:CFDP2 protein [Atractosteus spatula]